ncbi:MAG: NfeD family protein [candidate division Zixibacteria bacterium]
MPAVFWIWMAAAAIFLIIELTTPSMMFLSFVAGALVAGLWGGLYPEQYYWQIGLFLLVSVGLLPLMRKFAKRITKDSAEITNVDRMIGKNGTVIKPIDPDEPGQVKFEGEVWSATADVAIEEHARVSITSVTGVRVHVERVEH